MDGPGNNGRVDLGPGVVLTIEAGVSVVCGGATGENWCVVMASATADLFLEGGGGGGCGGGGLEGFYLCAHRITHASRPASPLFYFTLSSYIYWNTVGQSGRLVAIGTEANPISFDKFSINGDECHFDRVDWGSVPDQYVWNLS